MRWVYCVAVLSVSFSVKESTAVEFDCVELPADLTNPVQSCFDNPDPTGWCACLKSGFTSDKAGDFASIEQAHIYAIREPTPGKNVLTVGGGTLDLGGLNEGDKIGQILIDVNIGQPPLNFILDEQFVVTLAEENLVEFDVILEATSAVTNAVLTYNPNDELHSGGLMYRGKVESFGVNGGYELTYEFPDYFTDPTLLPDGATSTAIEIGDLRAPGFSVPALTTFPTMEIYRLGTVSPFTVTTVITQILSDPAAPIEKIFEEEFTLKTATPPAAPAGLVATAGTGQVTLDWTKNAEADLQGYNVFRSETAGGPYDKIAGIIAANHHVDTTVLDRRTYCYVVRAVGPGGESPSSQEVCATPKPPEVTFRRGEINGDRQLDLSDPVGILNYLFLAGEVPGCLDAADVNDDGAVDLSDPVGSLNFQFLAGPAPPAPGPFECGPDLAEDTLAPCVSDC